MTKKYLFQTHKRGSKLEREKHVLTFANFKLHVAMCVMQIQMFRFQAQSQQLEFAHSNTKQKYTW